jgi:predicted RNase H-like nuclease
LLEEAGIDLSSLTNIDLIDAALCALTAYHAAMGGECVSYGEPNTGLIIVPALPLALVWATADPSWLPVLPPR